jgi:hypothetical protein
MSNSRDISQFSAFLTVDDSTKNIGIATTATPYVGIGTTNPTSKLHVVGNVLIVGVSTLGVTSATNLTAQQLNVSGISTLGVTSATNLTAQQLNVSGITTLGVTSATNLTAQQLNVSGITTLGVTSATNLTAQQLNVSGISTLGVTSATNLTAQQLNVSGITTLGITSATNLTSQQLNVSGITTLGITSTTNLTSQQLNVSGISTLGITSTTNLTSQQLNVSGISTLGVTSTTNLTSQQLNVSGISTLGITSTTNLRSQQLNVSGITTLGITSTTNLTSQQLNVSGITTLGVVTSGNIYSTGVVTATQFSTGSSGITINTDTISGPAIMYIDPSPVGVGTTSGAVRIKGDLYVDGTQFIVNSTTIELADFNVGIATTVGTNILLDGAGIGIGSANIRKTFTYSSSPSDSLKSSENLDIASGKVYKIAGTEVLSSTQLTVANINASTGVTTLGVTSATNLTSQQLNVSGISTLGITSATNLTSQQLNVSGITTLGITSATNLTSQQLNVSGISTLGITSATNLTAQQLNVSGITTLGVTSTTNLTSQQLNVSGISTLGITSTTNLRSQQLNVSGITTLGITSATNLTAQQLNVSGISTLGITSTTNLTSQQLNVSGITTLGVTSATNLTSQQLNVSGITTLGITSTTNLTSQQLNVSGITTLGITSATNLTSQQLNVSGITTLGVTSATNLTSQQLNVSGISTFNGNVYVPSSSVGIGTTNPLQRLQIGTANTLGINTNGTVFVVTSNADVGIGTTNPIAKLHVIGDGRFTGVITATTFVGSLTGTASTAGVSTSVIGGIASVTQLSVSGISTFNNDVHIPSSSVGIGTTNPLQRLQIGTANTLGINTNGTVFVVTSNADVGIGTTNPRVKLDVVGDGRFTGVITATTFSGTLSGFASTAGVSTSVIGGIASVTQLTVSGISTFNGNVYVPSSSVGIGTTNPLQRLQIGTANTLGINTTGTVFVVTSNADVGIGTTNPIAKLHVIGDGRFTGVITATTFVGSLTGTATSLSGGDIGNIPYQSGANATAFLTNGGTGTILQSNGIGATPSWITPAPAGAITGLTIRDEGTPVGGANSVSTLNFVGAIVSAASTAGIATITFLDYVGNAGFATNAGIATNLKGGDIGNIPYQSGSNTTVFLTNGSPGTILQSNGIGATPSWVSATPSGAISGITVRDSNSNIVGTSGSITQLTFSTGLSVNGTTGAAGIATITLSSNIVGTALSISGISTFTNGPVFIGTATSTGTASQPLQVSGSAYIAGDSNFVALGIGITNNTTYPVDIRLSSGTNTPQIRISPSTNTRVAGIIYANAGSSNMFAGILNSAGQATNFTSGNLPAYAGMVGMSAGTSPLLLVTNALERVRVFDTGEVGIGTTVLTGTASQRLQVSGGAYVSGNLGVGITNPASNTQVAIAGTFGISEVGGAGTRTLFTSSTSGFTLNHNDNSQITFQTLGTNRLTYSHSSNFWTIPAGIPFLVGTASSTGTANQLLRVEGGAYVSGNLGIGTTNPGATLNVVPTATSIAGLFSGTTSSDMVRITQLGTGNALVVEDSTNPDSSPFVVTGIGSVGIGTASPAFTADIAGDARVTSTNKMRFGGTSSTTNFYIQYNSTTNSLDFVSG